MLPVKLILIVLAAVLAALAALGVGHPRFHLGWASLFCFELTWLVS